MREMKDSGVEWIGEIPQDWIAPPTKYLFTVLSGATPKSGIDDYFGDDIPWITPADYKTEDKYIYIGKRSLTTQGFDSCSASLVPKGSIIFSKRAPIGSVAISANNLSTNQGCLSCVPKRRMVIDYFYYLMSICTEQYELLGSGTTFKEISALNFANFTLLWPSLTTQKEIAAYLNEKCTQIGTLISNVQAQIEKLKAYKQSLITEVVTKGLDPTVPMKDSKVKEIGNIPSKWDVRKMLFCLSMPITDGPHTTPELYDDGIPFVSAEAVSCGNGSIDFSHIRGYISKEFYDECCLKYIPQRDDIYMIKSGATTGKVSIVDTDEIFTIWSPLAVMRCDNNIIIPRYLFYYLQSSPFQLQVNLGWNYGTQQNIGMRTLEKLKVVVPSTAEQHKIVDHLDEKCTQIDRLIAIKQQKIEKMTQYKKSLIYEYVTGKKEVG